VPEVMLAVAPEGGRLRPTRRSQEQRRDRDRSFHLACVTTVCHLWQFVHRARSMALDRGLRR
jgi:hypothetical protein